MFKSVAEASDEWPGSIDTAEINIEGGEYELIRGLSEIGFLERIQNVFVQFHDIGQETEEQIGRARARLEVTHDWCGVFIEFGNFGGNRCCTADELFEVLGKRSR